jgi:hypothetical protein
VTDSTTPKKIRESRGRAPLADLPSAAVEALILADRRHEEGGPEPLQRHCSDRGHAPVSMKKENTRSFLVAAHDASNAAFYSLDRHGPFMHGVTDNGPES